MSLVAIAVYQDLPTAEMAADLVRKDGIPVHIENQNLNLSHPFYAGAAGGISLMVPMEVADEARRIVSLIQSADLSINDSEENVDGIVCEQCGSSDVIEYRPYAFGAILMPLLLPLAFIKRHYCKKCRYKFKV